MKKRMLSLILVLSLCLAFLPAGAMAEGEDLDQSQTEQEAAWQTEEGGSWVTGSFKEAVDAVYPGGTVRLMKDVAVTGSVTITQSMTITSDGAENWVLSDPQMGYGYFLEVTGENTAVTLAHITIEGGGAEEAAWEPLIYMEGGASLTLGDGAILQGGNNTAAWEPGGAIGIADGCVTMLEGAVIRDCYGYYGGAVAVCSDDAAFTMEGGTISGNRAVCGGGLYVTGGNVTLSGGIITNNAAESDYDTAHGGGVLVSTSTKVAVSGEIQITGNRSDDHGVDNVLLEYHYDDENYVWAPTQLYLSGALSEKADVGITICGYVDNGAILAQGDGYPVTDEDMMALTLDHDEFVLTRGEGDNAILCLNVIEIDGDNETRSILYKGISGTAEFLPADESHGGILVLRSAILPADLEVSGQLMILVEGESEIVYDVDGSKSDLITITGDTLYTALLVNSNQDKTGLLHIFDGEVETCRVVWSSADGIQLTNSLLTVVGEKDSEVNLVVNKLVLDDRSEIDSRIPLSSYTSEEGSYDFSALTHFLPAGYTIGCNTTDLATEITILDENGNTAPSFLLGKQPIRPQSVKLDRMTVHLEVGETDTLTATISPENVGDSTLFWLSSDPEVVSVDETGKLTALSVGIATITVITQDDGKTATCSVTVAEKSGEDPEVTPADPAPSTPEEESPSAPTEDPTPEEESPSAPAERPDDQAESQQEETPGAQEEIEEEVTNAALSYTDLDQDAWYWDSVCFVIGQKLMVGYGNGCFAPGDTLTRAQMVQILYNRAGRPQVEDQGTCPFDDVSPGKWYYDAICWAAENGIVAGYRDNLFGPEDPITREQFAQMIWNNESSPQPSVTSLSFTDGETASSWAVDALLWASETGLIQGYEDGSLNPTATATRAEAAAMLMRYYSE